MTKEETMDITEFVNRLWTEYPRDLCHKRPGTKPNLESAAKKVKVTEYKQILLDMDALKRYDRMDKDPDRWPAASRWLNGQYWTRVLESVMQKKEKKPDKFCKCGQVVDIAPTGECVECYAKRTDQNLHKRKNVLQDLGLYKEGQSRSEVIANCREALLPQVNSGSCYKVKPIPFLQSSSKSSEPESSESSTKVIYGEEWFKENAERVYGATGMKFDV